MDKNKLEKRDRERCLKAARDAFAACTQEERAMLFREFGNCVCVKAVAAAVKRPRMVVGALIGALVVEGLAAMDKTASPVLKSAQLVDPSLVPTPRNGT